MIQNVTGSPMRMDVQDLLAQMRQMREVVDRDLQVNVRETNAPAGDENSFATQLQSAVGSVNELQMQAGQKTDAFVRGESTDLVSVMIATQKADVAFQGLLQTRNRLVSAYQDIMNMPI